MFKAATQEGEMLSRVIEWVLGAAGRVTAAPCPQEVGFYRIAVGRRAWGSFTLEEEGTVAAVAPSAGSRLVAGACVAAGGTARRSGLDQASTQS
jgi:hypothetical protein